MKPSKKQRYLGDVYTIDSKIDENIQMRYNKGVGIVNNIISILKHIIWKFLFWNCFNTEEFSLAKRDTLQHRIFVQSTTKTYKNFRRLLQIFHAKNIQLSLHSTYNRILYWVEHNASSISYPEKKNNVFMDSSTKRWHRIG